MRAFVAKPDKSIGYLITVSCVLESMRLGMY